MKDASGRNRSVRSSLGEAERHQKQFHGKDFSVIGFGASSFASTTFILASVVLKPLQEVFKLMPCFPALHALFENLSASVVVQLPCERGICRYLFDRGKHSAVSCVSSFVQKHASERKETATSHQPGIGRAAVVPVTACASSEKQLQVATTFGSKDIAWEVVAECLSSFDTPIARHGFKELRKTVADVSKSGDTCSSFRCAERGLKDNAASPSKLLFRCSAASSHQATHLLIARSKYLSTLQPEAPLPGVRQQERSSRCLRAQGLFSETTPSGQRLAGRILQTFPDKRGCVRTVSVPTDNGVFNQLLMSFCFLVPVSGNPQLRTASSTRVELASDHLRGLAVKWTVHFLQRQPAVTVDNVFFQEGGRAPVATEWSVTLYRRTAVPTSCVFLADGKRIAPLATNKGLFFSCTGQQQCTGCNTQWAVFLQGATDVPAAVNYGLLFCR